MSLTHEPRYEVGVTDVRVLMHQEQRDKRHSMQKPLSVESFFFSRKRADSSSTHFQSCDSDLQCCCTLTVFVIALPIIITLVFLNRVEVNAPVNSGFSQFTHCAGLFRQPENRVFIALWRQLSYIWQIKLNFVQTSVTVLSKASGEGICMTCSVTAQSVHTKVLPHRFHHTLTPKNKLQLFIDIVILSLFFHRSETTLASNYCNYFKKTKSNFGALVCL